MMVTTDSATPIYAARLYNVALAILGANPNGANKRAAGAVSAMELRRETTAALIAGQPLQFAYGQEGLPLILETKEPVVLVPGWGVLITNQVLSSTLGATFDYTEFLP
jgi:hypothetical protein